jgi:succinyl-diaminopimelate desuccinylase
MAALNLDLGLVELTMAICDIESVSGNESELADAIELTLRAQSHLELLRDGDALVARTNLGREQRVIIAGHIDTVPVKDNLPTELMHFEREQVIFGRGTVDMKSGVAVMLKLAAELRESSKDITWVFYDHEEVDANLNGLGRLVRNHPSLWQADFAVLCEPTSALVEGGCNGTIRIEVSAQGKRAHSARPWMGENAIHAAAEILNRLNDYQPETINVDGLEYRESLNAVLMHAGVATNVIPDLAVVTVNYRFAPSRSLVEAESALRELFQGFDVKSVDAAAGARPGMDTKLAQDFVAATGVSVRPKYGWTDVARFAELGIPAVNYGPGDPSLAHADNEHVPVGHLFDVESGLRNWLTGSAS